MALLPNTNTCAPEGYDSIVLAADFYDEDVQGGEEGHHYNYKLQEWVDGHDHAHVDAAGYLKPLFCGGDADTCLGLPLDILA